MWIALILLAPCWAGPDSPESEQTEEAQGRAKELFQKGSALYEEGNYEAALLSFREAQAVFPSALMHFNIANCYERVGRLDDAIRSMNLYREVAPAGEQDTLERRVKAMQTRLDARDSTSVVSPLGPATVSQPAAYRTEARPRWGLVGLGAGAGLVGGALTAVSLSDEEAGTYQALGVSTIIAGAAVAGVGLAIPVRRPVRVGISPRSEGAHFIVAGRL